MTSPLVGSILQKHPIVPLASCGSTFVKSLNSMAFGIGLVRGQIDGPGLGNMAILKHHANVKTTFLARFQSDRSALSQNRGQRLVWQSCHTYCFAQIPQRRTDPLRDWE